MYSEDFRKQTYRFEFAKILFFDIIFPQKSYRMISSFVVKKWKIFPGLIPHASASILLDVFSKQILHFLTPQDLF